LVLRVLVDGAPEIEVATVDDDGIRPSVGPARNVTNPTSLYLVEEGQACFNTENLQRLKSIPLSEVSPRFMQSVWWKDDSVLTKRK
jgi:hypothetical protein